MNAERLLRMIFRRVARRAVNRGINKSIDHIAGAKSDGNDKRQQRAAKNMSRKARKSARLLRRFGKF